MFKPFSLFVGLRYTRAKRRNQFLSFISLASMLGIALGVAVLITVLSVMNGFDREIRNNIFSMARQASITSVTGVIDNWQNLQEKVAKQPGVHNVAPYVDGQSLLSHNGVTTASMVEGVLPKQEQQMSVLKEKLVYGSLDDLKPGKFGILIGDELAINLGLNLGDKVTVIVPQTTVTPLGVMPTYKPFTVVGIFHVGNGLGFDDKYSVVHLNDAQALFRLGKNVSGLRLKMADLYQAPAIAAQVESMLPAKHYTTDWTQAYGAFFKTLQMERTMMFLILVLIIAVAAFNLISSLVMTVRDKQADIAILKTMGANSKTIMRIFIIQGSVIGITGIVLGLIGGILLALNVTEVVRWLETILHTHFISASFYHTDYLPSQIIIGDLIRITSVALLLSLAATIYPAWSAANVKPAEALRYE